MEEARQRDDILYHKGLTARASPEYLARRVTDQEDLARIAAGRANRAWRKELADKHGLFETDSNRKALEAQEREREAMRASTGRVDDFEEEGEEDSFEGGEGEKDSCSFAEELAVPDQEDEEEQGDQEDEAPCMWEWSWTPNTCLGAGVWTKTAAFYITEQGEMRVGVVCQPPLDVAPVHVGDVHVIELKEACKQSDARPSARVPRCIQKGIFWPGVKLTLRTPSAAPVKVGTRYIAYTCDIMMQDGGDEHTVGGSCQASARRKYLEEAKERCLKLAQKLLICSDRAHEQRAQKVGKRNRETPGPLDGTVKRTQMAKGAPRLKSRGETGSRLDVGYSGQGPKRKREHEGTGDGVRTRASRRCCAMEDATSLEMKFADSGWHAGRVSHVDKKNRTLTLSFQDGHVVPNCSFDDPDMRVPRKKS